MAGTWCTIADVANLTAVTVTEPQLLRTQGVIETFVDIDPADPGDHLTDRDRERLRKATAYQAGWMFEQIDYVGRTDVETLSQDGSAIKYAHPDAATLAPLAKRNIDKLEWNESGSYTAANGSVKYNDLDEVRVAVLCDEVELPWQFESWSL